MFRCEQCNKVVGSGIAARLIITNTRRKEYPYRKHAFRALRFDEKRGKWIRGRVDDRGGIGSEIVKEIKVCPHYPDCVAKQSVVK